MTVWINERPLSERVARPSWPVPMWCCFSKADLAGEADCAARKVIDGETPRRAADHCHRQDRDHDPRVILGLNAAAEDDLDARPAINDPLASWKSGCNLRLKYVFYELMIIKSTD